jgi:streptogramin lyase
MRIRRILPVVLAVLAALPVASAAGAPRFDQAFELPNVQTNGQLTLGPDGNIWVSLDGAVGRVTPAGGVTEYTSTDLPNVLAFPTGAITSGAGFIWVGQSGGNDPLVKIPPGNPAGATGVPVAGLGSLGSAMTTGPDGNIWFAVNDKIVKFAPSNPAGATTYDAPGLVPRGIATATDGTLWVTDTANGGRLLNVTTNGTVTPHTVGGQPQFVGGGASNGQVAFGNPNSAPQQIGLLTASATTPITLDRPNGSDPFGVTFGNDGAFWIAEFAGNRLARVTTDGQLTTLTGFPTLSGQAIGPRQITTGPNNTLWATLDTPGDATKSKIARITGVEPPPATTTPPPDGGTPGGNTPPPDTIAPTVSAAGFARSTVKAGTKTVVFRFTLSEAGSAKLVLSRRLPGRRRGARCVKPTRRLRGAKRCTRLVPVRTATIAAIAGSDTIRLRVRGLPAGRYVATLTVADAAGNAAAPITRKLRIVRR